MKKALIWIVVILVVVAVWFFLAYKPAAEPDLTEEIALEALRPQLFADCLPGGMADTYRSCRVELFEESERQGWIVRITYDGLYDDSVQASRLEAYLTIQEGEWAVGDVIETTKCSAGRGHQDFSAELCA